MAVLNVRVDKHFWLLKAEEMTQEIQHVLPELLIDYIPRHPHEVILIHQIDPHPGGHQYEWRIPIELVNKKTLDDAKFVSTMFPDRSIAMDWFWWLRVILGRWNNSYSCCNEAPPLHRVEFVLNTIDSMKVSETLIEVAGRCSPFVRNLPKMDELK